MLGAQLFYFFALTVLVTVIVSPLAVWHYGRRVLAGMQQRGSPALPVPPLPLEQASPPSPAAAPDEAAAAWLAWERVHERRVIAAWLLTMALAALPVALVYLLASDALQHAAQWVLVAAVLTNVASPVIAMSRGWGWRRGLGFAARLMVGLALATWLFSMLQRLAMGRAPTLDQALNLVVYAQLAAVMLALPALLLVLSTPRRIRQVVPLVFGALVMFALAPFLGTRAFDQLAGSSWGASVLPVTGIGGARNAAFALLALPMGWLVARRLRALAAAHAAKRFSDVQLLARTWWLMQLCGLVVELFNARDVPWWGGPACALAGLALLPANAAALRWLAPGRGAPPPRTLLFLRAFGWQARTELLFDRLGARWRSFGPITMIAAPDVVARSIDSVDLLAWLQGREGEVFIHDADDLAARLAAVDRAPDPDGRYRLNEFCCADPSWQATVVALMAGADAVLMDLRGVVGDKAGCAFELGQLALRLPARRVVLVVDGHTALAPLREALGGAADAVTWQRLDSESDAGQQALFRALLRAAA